MNKIDLFISLGLSSLLSFLFNLTAYVIIAFIDGTTFSTDIFFLIVLILNLYLLSLGVGMILSIIYIYLKDINHLIDILILVGFWTSGIIFPPETVLEKLPILYYLNPFLGMLTNVRSILVYNEEINFVILNLNLLTGMVLYGFGVYSVDILETNAFIGYIGFSCPTWEAYFTPCVEVGWRLKASSWNKGYATEGALACLDYGFNTIGFKSIYSWTATCNIPSERVMQKIGLLKIDEFDHPRIEKGDRLERHVLYGRDQEFEKARKRDL